MPFEPGRERAAALDIALHLLQCLYPRCELIEQRAFFLNALARRMQRLIGLQRCVARLPQLRLRCISLRFAFSQGRAQRASNCCSSCPAFCACAALSARFCSSFENTSRACVSATRACATRASVSRRAAASACAACCASLLCACACVCAFCASASSVRAVSNCVCHWAHCALSVSICACAR